MSGHVILRRCTLVDWALHACGLSAKEIYIYIYIHYIYIYIHILLRTPIGLAIWGGRINPDNFDWKKLFKKITIAFFVYLIFSSTLHPWYVLPLLAFSLFTNYAFPLAWSFVIFFSYVFYEYVDNSVWQVRVVSTIEYALVIGLFVWEMVKGGVRRS